MQFIISLTKINFSKENIIYYTRLHACLHLSVINQDSDWLYNIVSNLFIYVWLINKYFLFTGNNLFLARKLKSEKIKLIGEHLQTFLEISTTHYISDLFMQFIISLTKINFSKENIIYNTRLHDPSYFLYRMPCCLHPPFSLYSHDWHGHVT
jgi:hypothetical protein